MKRIVVAAALLILVGCTDAVPGDLAPDAEGDRATVKQTLKFSRIVFWGELDVRGLTTSDIQAMTVNQIKQIPERLIVHLKAGQLNVMSTTQIRALTTDQIPSLVYTAIGDVNPQLFAALTDSQIAALGAVQIGYLVSKQVAAVTPKNLAVLFGYLNFGTFEALTPEQYAIVTPKQIATLSWVAKQAFDLRGQVIAKAKAG
ncbi:MAG: hypothetical protein H7338_16035 [Candidatus Sericytochromatia bacterium]|nr:hypothetical protein [Candidatus Sericytochromatia bacterium]